MIEHFLQCRRRIVLEVRGGSTDSTELGDVHHAEVGGLSRQQQSSRVGGRDRLDAAVRERNLVRARVTVQPLRTRQEAVGGGARAGGRDGMIARDGAYECCVARRRARMQRAAVALSASP